VARVYCKIINFTDLYTHKHDHQYPPLLCVQLQFSLNKEYSRTCLQWSVMGNNKSGLCWQVAVVWEN